MDGGTEATLSGTDYDQMIWQQLSAKSRFKGGKLVRQSIEQFVGITIFLDFSQSTNQGNTQSTNRNS
jgi:hypothetical protein